MHIGAKLNLAIVSLAQTGSGFEDWGIYRQMVQLFNLLG